MPQPKNAADHSDTLSTELLAEARCWIADCFSDAPKRLTNAEVVDAIRRHYEGGLPAFRQSI